MASASPDELNALMGSDNQQPTDPIRPGDSLAFYLALVCRSLSFFLSPSLTGITVRHQHLSVVVSPQPIRLSPFQPNTGFGSLNMDHHFVQ